MRGRGDVHAVVAGAGWRVSGAAVHAGNCVCAVQASKVFGDWVWTARAVAVTGMLVQRREVCGCRRGGMRVCMCMYVVVYMDIHPSIHTRLETQNSLNLRVELSKVELLPAR
jgi:hypothetical protein